MEDHQEPDIIRWFNQCTETERGSAPRKAVTVMGVIKASHQAPEKNEEV